VLEACPDRNENRKYWLSGSQNDEMKKEEKDE
jgi:hypothetical protein